MRKIFIILLLILNHFTFGQVNPFEKDIIISDFNESLKSILKVYKNPNHLIDVNILDIENTSYLNFLYTQNFVKHDEELATLYFNNLSRNNIPMKLCFILYDNNSNIVGNYIKNLKISYEDTIDYLSLHEMGHCIYDYYKNIDPQKYKNLSEKNNEILADYFAFSFLYKKNKDYLFKIIIENLKIQNDIHKNYEKLMSFAKDIKSIDNLKYNQIFDYCFLKISND
jgi:hypothetical protein